MKKLAIYYGWPSLVKRSFEDKPGTLDDAVKHFSHFDMLVFGDGLESPGHLDYSNTKHIITALHEQDKEVHGYIHLSTSDQFPILSDDQLLEKLQKWKDVSMKGVLFDLLDPGYGTTEGRIEKISAAAHNIGLSIFYNADLDAANGWLKERIAPFAITGDKILIEPFGTSWAQESYTLPETLPQSLKELQFKGVEIMGVSTYNAEQSSIADKKGRDVLIDRFLHYRDKAKHLGLDGYQFTNGEYSASGREANILFDFNTFVK